MKVVLFGGTGMVGSGALIECLAHRDVDAVFVVGRRSCGVEHEKLEELVVSDFFDFSAIAERFAGVDACLFCVGVSALGMSEEDYSRITYDMTVVAAEALAAASPRSTFVYVSGAGTHRSEKGVRSQTKMYDAIYAALTPFSPFFPKLVTTTEKLGLALIRAARVGAPQPVLEVADINALAAAEATYLAS